MSVLDTVTRGKLKQPHLLLIYGPDGVGKSTFGASAPDPLFIGSESGTENLDVTRKTVETWKETIAYLTDLAAEKHPFKTIVLDSLDWFEPLVWDHVCEVNEWASIEAPGYGKGYVAALKEWQNFVKVLKALRSTGLNIILVGHSQVKTVQSPQHNTAYDRYQLKLNDKAGALFREFVDSVLFSTYEVFVKADKPNGKGKAYGDGARVMYTEHRPAFDAKNRFGLKFQLPLSWEEYEKGIESKDGEKPEALIEAIKAIAKDLPTPELKESVKAKLAEFGTDPQKLMILKNKVSAAIGAAA